MNTLQVLELYGKERAFQKRAFGDYKDVNALNFASFLLLIEEYLNKAKQAYAGKWSKDLPPWLEGCTEFTIEGTAPIKSYEEVVKIMALAGAALETYGTYQPDEWRADLESDLQKWEQ
jgi:hypothetical protein